MLCKRQKLIAKSSKRIKESDSLIPANFITETEEVASNISLANDDIKNSGDDEEE
jgi:hypothetical protein